MTPIFSISKHLIFLILLLSFSVNALDNSDKNLNIAVVGAGPAGLMAAAELQKRGYNNVTIFEASGVVGGKVKSVKYKGQTYEIGAVITAPDYDIVLGIAKELNIELTTTPESKVISTTGEVTSMSDCLKRKCPGSGYIDHVFSTWNFSSFIKNNQAFFKPGYENTPEILNQSYEDFAVEQGSYTALDMFRPAMVGCGYGYAEDKSAAYWVKLMKTFIHERAAKMFTSSFYKGFPQGWQNLWEKFAESRQLNIKLHSPVTKIDRMVLLGNVSIAITANDEVSYFDRVIVTVPHIASRFMDFTAAEEATFSKVKTIKYKTTLVEIENLPRNLHLWPRAYSYKYDDDGQPNDGNVALISNHHGTNVYQAYQFTEAGKTSDELLAILHANLTKMGARMGKVVSEDLYDYFPHFDVQAFKDGIPQNMHKLQGTFGTYYTGALMDFEIVELAARHGKYVVETYF